MRSKPEVPRCAPEAMVLSSVHTPFIMVQLRKFWAGSPQVLSFHPTFHHKSRGCSQKPVPSLIMCSGLYVFTCLTHTSLDPQSHSVEKSRAVHPPPLELRELKLKAGSLISPDRCKPRSPDPQTQCPVAYVTLPTLSGKFKFMSRRLVACLNIQ